MTSLIAPLNVMDSYRDGAIRFGILWNGNNYSLFWTDAPSVPTITDVRAFVGRQPSVYQQLASRGLAVSDFLNDWHRRRLQRFDLNPLTLTQEMNRESIFVAVPTGWVQTLSGKSALCIIYKSGITGRDILAVGWQSETREVLDFVMTSRSGASRLAKWVDELSDDGVWDACIVEYLPETGSQS